MSKLVCFKHPRYVGHESPVLSCKACCSIFIAEIKLQNSLKAADTQNAAAATGTFDAKKWLDEKAQEARQAVKKKSSVVHSVNPDLI